MSAGARPVIWTEPSPMSSPLSFSAICAAVKAITKGEISAVCLNAGSGAASALFVTAARGANGIPLGNRSCGIPAGRKSHHLLSFHIPDFQAEAAEYIQRIEGRGFRILQFRHARFYFRQTVEGHARIQMMNVVITDICGEPGHQRAH